MGQFGSIESASSYETTANTFLANVTWNPKDNTEVFWDITWVSTKAEWMEMSPQFASDVPAYLFQNQVPGPGADPAAPPPYPIQTPPGVAASALPDGDYTSLSTVGEYSKLQYDELRTTAGVRWQVTNLLGVFGQVSYWDLDDKTQYLFQDLSGRVLLGQAGLTFYF